jgi:hypothetical protein
MLLTGKNRKFEQKGVDFKNFGSFVYELFQEKTELQEIIEQELSLKKREK